ncbi:flavodoxin family protein [Paenibacillus sp. 1011MAR3C5]|uniref:NAD(P)H-dependent oxidoreductase n=1 Tax=Paenibacillus sp. 1011MAR3C5 TaxID=1675787 RepID=UPI000E6D57E4|nr:NAD(P)H-dependent oxidoreductase [Paenibacillus sp. 1011MAR3C5]RJE90407.1 flavodoxin family protein [Paenibacillus sp. 1011MAR3C5]
MKHLIIYAHPRKESFNHAILETSVRGLRQKGHEVVVRDLYAMKFQPVISSSEILGGVGEDIEQEQEYLKWAEVITFIYPIWWTGLPAIVKGYIERVFSYGFAYRYVNGEQKGMLKGKKAVVINTLGKSHAEYVASGMDRALLLTSDKGIFEYCGMEVQQHVFFESVPSSDEATRTAWLQQIEELAGKN